MAQRDPRIDEKIARAAPFARPILEHSRALVHKAVPGAGETVKWGMPHFTYKGKNVAGMNAFNAHCAFMVHGDGRQGEAMGQFGKIATLSDLTGDDVLAARLAEACARIDAEGSAIKRPKPKKPTAETAIPQDLATALHEAPKAKATFDGFPPSQRREYVDWISEAKQDATRAKRLATAIEWLAEGKRRNWKYEKR